MNLKKIVYWIGWISGIFGAVLMLGGVIGYFIHGEFLHVRNYYNWFYIANSFLFLGIFCIVVSRLGCEGDKAKE